VTTPSTTSQTSKLAAAGLMCTIPAIPVASIAWAARGSDSEWIATVGTVVVAILVVSSVALAATGMVLIAGSRGRLTGYGCAIAALVLDVPALVALAVLLVGLAAGR